ncbi:MAG: hypothetical protein HYX47_00125 [Burkholderiales bacterium]|nr:hypothetical protein [Burkholderiales bacterium]
MNTFSSTRRFFCAAAAAAAALAATSAVAADPWPTKPVRLIVPYTAGGSNDVVARLYGERLSAYWGQPVIVENRPGVGGNIGSALVAKSPADGYTLLITPNNLPTMNPFMYSKDKLGYDVARDFEPISMMARGPILLTVNAKLPVNSVRELVAYAKANVGKLSYASAGVGTPHHLTAELFKSEAGINALHVPYRGAAPAVTDLVSGEVQMMFGIPNSPDAFCQNRATQGPGRDQQGHSCRPSWHTHRSRQLSRFFLGTLDCADGAGGHPRRGNREDSPELGAGV